MCKNKAFLLHKSFASEDHLGRQCKKGEFHQVQTEGYNLDFHWELYGYCASDLSWLWDGWCIHTMQFRPRCHSIQARLDSSVGTRAWNRARASIRICLVPQQLSLSISTVQPRCGLSSSYTLQKYLRTLPWMQPSIPFTVISFKEVWSLWREILCPRLSFSCAL